MPEMLKFHPYSILTGQTMQWSDLSYTVKWIIWWKPQFFFQKLTSAVSSLPLLLEKKRLIDMHTSLATAILDQIKLRKLDLFFELEEKILSKQNLDKSLKEVSKNTYRISHLLIRDHPYITSAKGLGGCCQQNGKFCKRPVLFMLK